MNMFGLFTRASLKEKLLNACPEHELDQRLSDVKLSIISQNIPRWEAKATAFGLSAVEIEDIKQDYQYNDMRRVAMLRKWVTKFGERATLRTLIDLSVENNWISFIRSVCSSLGYIDEYTGYSVSVKHIGASVLIIGILAIVLKLGPVNEPYVSQTLPNAKQDFFGRDREIENLLAIIDFSNDSFRFVNIIGSPGFGKSALAVNIGHKMLDRRTEVHYINLMDFPDKNFKQVLAERILIDDSYMDKGVTFENLMKWARNRWWRNCLIILDNCDKSIEEQKEEFYYAVETLLMHSGSHLKILTTSREAILHSDSHFVHKLHPIDTESACQVLEFRNPTVLSEDEKHTIARLTGEVPLALKITRALLSNGMNSATEIIENLKKEPIPTLSPPELQSSMRLNASISLSYNYLENYTQKVGQYLSIFQGSFDLGTAVGVLNPLTNLRITSQVKSSLKKLTQLSLLEFDEKSHRYHYHKLIRDYFNKNINPEVLGNFVFGLAKYYSVKLCDMAKRFKRSPRTALYQLDLDRHHIELLMAFIKLDLFTTFNRDLATCFLKALETKYLNCRFTPLEIITVILHLSTTFLNSIKLYMLSNIYQFSLKSLARDMSSDFVPYSGLAIELSYLFQAIGKNEAALLRSKAQLKLVDMFCEYNGTEEACRHFYTYILTHFEDKFDSETAKLYHIKFLEKSEASQTKCRSPNSIECNAMAIAISYSNLKNYKKAKKFFEKALFDENFQYSTYDRLYALLWLRRNFRTSISMNKIENDLKDIFDHLVNMTAAELYGGPSSFIQEYQDFLKEVREYNKAYEIQEYWIQVMEEIGLKSSVNEIKLAGDTATKLYRKGRYNRSLNVVKHVLSVIQPESHPGDYIFFQQLKGCAMYWMNNKTESNKAFRIAIEQLIFYNRTSEIRFEQLCWDLLYYLHDVDYIWICYSHKLKTQAYFISEAFLYLLLKAPFEHVSIKSPKRSRKVDISLEYFPSLSQQSHRTDLMSDEAGEVYIFKPDFSAFTTPLTVKLLGIVKAFCTSLIELNSLRLCCNIVSIFVRLVIVWLLFQTLCYIISRCYRILRLVLYFIIIFLCVKAKWL